MGEKIEMRAGAQAPPPRQGVVPTAIDTTHRYARIGSIDEVRSEIDDAFTDMRDFYISEPDEVMRKVSGHLARLAEISKEIRRVENGPARQLKAIRTNEIDPTMKDLWEQYQIASRLLESRKIDFAISGIQT